MTIIKAPKQTEQKSKVVRLSLYPKDLHQESKEKRKRWAPQTSKGPKLRPGQKLPYFRDLPGKQQPAYGPAQTTTPIQPQGVNTALIIIGVILFILILYAIFSLNNNYDNNNNRRGGTPKAHCFCNSDESSYCTSNRQCPEEIPGVPGICGCPVD